MNTYYEKNIYILLRFLFAVLRFKIFQIAILETLLGIEHFQLLRQTH